MAIRDPKDVVGEPEITIDGQPFGPELSQPAPMHRIQAGEPLRVDDSPCRPKTTMQGDLHVEDTITAGKGIPSQAQFERLLKLLALSDGERGFVQAALAVEPDKDVWAEIADYLEERQHKEAERFRLPGWQAGFDAGFDCGARARVIGP